jgi:hypothetical protein
LVLSGCLLAVVWISMWALLQRSADTFIPISLAMTTLVAGLMVMMAGYLKGGAATFPLAAALAGAGVASYPSRLDMQRTISIGVVGLFSVLFIGRFFGRLTTTTAVVVFLTPLLMWVAELPSLRQRKPWQILTIRLVLVAVPLLILLANAKRDFDRDLRPLLHGRQSDPPRGQQRADS